MLKFVALGYCVQMGYARRYLVGEQLSGWSSSFDFDSQFFVNATMGAVVPSSTFVSLADDILLNKLSVTPVGVLRVGIIFTEM